MDPNDLVAFLHDLVDIIGVSSMHDEIDNLLTSSTPTPAKDEVKTDAKK